MHRILALGAVSLLAAVLCADAAAWSWPADGAVLQPFTLGGDAYAAGQHRGIDVAGPDGSDVRAPASGLVTFAGSLPTYGRGVTILTSDGYAVTLVHLGAIDVAEGATVSEGAPIGKIGSSGTPEHSVPSVHLGIRRAADEQGYVDPLGLLPPRGGASDPSREPAPAPEPTTPPVTVESPAPPSPALPSGAASHSTPAAPAAPAGSMPAGTTLPGPDPEPVAATSEAAAAPDAGSPMSAGAPGSTGAASTLAPASAAAAAAPSASDPNGVPGGDAATPVFEVTPAAGNAPAAAQRPTRAPMKGPARSGVAGGASSPSRPAAPLAGNAVAASVVRPTQPRAAHADASTSERGLPVVGPRVVGHAASAARTGAHAGPVPHTRPTARAGATEPDARLAPVPVTQRALGGGTAVHASAGAHPAAPRRAEGPVAVVPPSAVPIDLRRVGLVAVLAVVLAAMVVRRAVRRSGGDGGPLLPRARTTGP